MLIIQVYANNQHWLSAFVNNQIKQVNIHKHRTVVHLWKEGKLKRDEGKIQDKETFWWTNVRGWARTILDSVQFLNNTRLFSYRPNDARFAKTNLRSTETNAVRFFINVHQEIWNARPSVQKAMLATYYCFALAQKRENGVPWDLLPKCAKLSQILEAGLFSRLF